MSEIMKKILTALIILLCLFACEVQKELNSTENIWIYAKIISADLNSVNCTIKIVGNDGNSVSGAIAMFLCRLFEQKGAAVYDNEVLTSDGGIGFLRTLVRSSETGWEGLDNAFGENADILFKNWVEELLMIQCGLCSDYRPMYHPTTKKLTNFPLFAGEIEISDSVSCFLNGLGKIENDTVSLLPYSFCFVNNLTFEQKGNFIVELNEENRNLLCSFYRH